jgi:hypothetical protein
MSGMDRPAFAEGYGVASPLTTDCHLMHHKQLMMEERKEPIGLCFIIERMFSARRRKVRAGLAYYAEARALPNPNPFDPRNPRL